MDEEHMFDLIQDDEEYVKNLRGIMKSGSLDLAESAYIIFGSSPEYHHILEKLIEQLPQCPICNKYYDSFPSQNATFLHISSCSTC